MSWTTDQLLEAVRREGRWSTDEPYPTAADILAVAREELLDFILPALHRRRSDCGVFQQDHAISAGQQGYRLSPRAWAGIVRDATILDDQGRILADLVQGDVEEIDYHAGVTSGVGSIQRFVTQGDRVMLLPTPSTTSGTLRLRLLRRPSFLVETTACSAIISTPATVFGNTQFNVNNETAIANGATVDLLQAQPGFDTLAQDVAYTRAGNVVSIPGPVENYPDLAVGSWVSAQHTTPVVPGPEELHAALILAVVARIQRQLGRDVWQSTRGEAVTKLNDVCDRLSPRNWGARTKVINPHSHVRGPRRYPWR